MCTFIKMMPIQFLLALLVAFVLVSSSPFVVLAAETYTGSWVIEVAGGCEKAKQVADEVDLLYNGPVGSLKDLYYVQHKKHTRLRRGTDNTHERLQSHEFVNFAEHQKLLKRVKRSYFKDPLYKLQWYIENQDAVKGKCSLDMNIVSVWKKGITGKGAVVTVVDDGIDYKHPDLKANYDAQASYDFNGHDNDPYPRYDLSLINKHGTRCAGEVAASSENSVCGVGVAYNAKVGGIRMLDGDVTDAVEAGSLSYNPSHIDIYTNSWGPTDDGRTVDGPAHLAVKAFENGVKFGRKGLGSIYVWATGNGGRSSDYCSCDGYINRIETIGIGAVDYCGNIPYYAEPCPGTLAVTYSSGDGYDKKIVTTDLHQRCTTSHTGTSAASPLAGGILALALEANPNITWRDMQHLIVKTSTILNPNDPSLTTNGAGYKVGTYRGFGVLDAGRLVEMASAKNWTTAGKQHICKSNEVVLNERINPTQSFESTLNSTGCSHTPEQRICKLEHVKLYLSIASYPRGGLEIKLTSPSGTVSPILKQRRHDTGKAFENWGFLSVYFWDESPEGTWKLNIIQHTARGATHIMKKWKLEFYGTDCNGDYATDISKTNVTTSNETSSSTEVNTTISAPLTLTTTAPTDTLTKTTTAKKVQANKTNSTLKPKTDIPVNNTKNVTTTKNTTQTAAAVATTTTTKTPTTTTTMTTTTTATPKHTFKKTTENQSSRLNNENEKRESHKMSILTGVLIGTVAIILFMGIVVYFKKRYWKLQCRLFKKDLEVKTFEDRETQSSLLKDSTIECTS